MKLLLFSFLMPIFVFSQNKSIKHEKAQIQTPIDTTALVSEENLLLEAKIFDGNKCNIQNGYIKLYRPDLSLGVYFIIEVHNGYYSGSIEGYLQRGQDQWLVYEEKSCIIKVKLDTSNFTVIVKQENCTDFSGAAVCFEGLYK